MCNPAALKAAEELHARSKGYSTSVVPAHCALLHLVADLSLDCDVLSLFSLFVCRARSGRARADTTLRVRGSLDVVYRTF